MIDLNDPRLTAYVLGELDGPDRELVEHAVAASSELQQEVAAIRRSVDLIEKSLQAEACPALTEEQRVTLGASAAAFEVRATRQSRGIRPWLAIAGSLAIALGCVAFFGINSLLLPTRDVAEGEAKSQSTSPGDSSRSHVEHSPIPVPAVSGHSLGNDLYGSNVDETTREIRPETSSDPSNPQRASRSIKSPTDASVRLFNPDEVRNMESLTESRRSVRVEEDPASGTPRMGMPGMPASRETSGGMGMPGMGMRGMGMPGMAPGRPGAADSRSSGGHPGMSSGDGWGAPQANFEAQPGTGLGSLVQQATEANDPVGAVQLEVREPSDAIMIRGDQTDSADVQKIVGGIDRLITELTPTSETESSAAAAVKATVKVAEAEVTEPNDINKRAPTHVPQNQVRRQELTEEQERAERKEKREPGTWRRAKATPNASRLMVGDRDELPMEGLQANVVVDGFRARVLLDLYFYNNFARQLEGNFQMRLPDDASLYYFAFGQSAYEYRPQIDQLASKGFLSADLLRDGGLGPTGILRAREGSWSNVKEARLVARDKAAHAYGETVRRRVDPALVEWSGAGVFNARVFPLMAGKLHRVVVGYDVTLQAATDGLVYRLELPEDVRQCMVDLNVAATPGASAEVTPACRPFTSNGRAFYNFSQPTDRKIEVRLAGTGPILLTGDDQTSHDKFFAARFVPDMPSDASHTSSSRAIFLVDTSLSSRPEKFNVWLKLLENVLNRNRDSIQEFSVVFFNIESHWWKDGFTPNTEENVNELMATCHSLSLAGATNLQQAIVEAVSPSWNDKSEKSDAPAPDLFLLSDGAATWGELNAYRIGEALKKGKAGSLFTYKTGLTATSTEVLEHLARESGGAVFSVVNETEIASAATAHRQRPWKLLDIRLPGANDVLVAGRPQYIYPGQPLLVVGRGQPESVATVRLARGEEQRVVELRFHQTLSSDLASRAYGQVAVGQLEDLGSNLEDVATAYARHFRVTGQTCSLLMLESEADYQRFQIKPEDDVFVVRSTPSADLVSRKLDELTEKLTDAKVALLNRLARLENTPGMQFRIPTALRLAIDRMPREKFDVSVPRLVCKRLDRGVESKDFSVKLDADALDYDAISAEAARRRDEFGAADALKLLSSLIERNPGDPVLARDVAFSAMESELSGQAFLLLQNVVQMRPFEPQSYQLLAQCLTELGNADLAIVYYEILMNSTWNERYRDVNRVVGVEYFHLLHRIKSGQLPCQAKEYAQARLESLASQIPIDQADLVVVLTWNTDRTDVDLHLVEPTGEECFYSHPRTKLGGEITADVTEGYGPEMYFLKHGQPGDYKILANYFGTDANRTQVRSKAYVTIYEMFGDISRGGVSKKVVLLDDQKQKRELATIHLK